LQGISCTLQHCGGSSEPVHAHAARACKRVLPSWRFVPAAFCVSASRRRSKSKHCRSTRLALRPGPAAPPQPSFSRHPLRARRHLSPIPRSLPRSARAPPATDSTVPTTRRRRPHPGAHASALLISQYPARTGPAHVTRYVVRTRYQTALYRIVYSTLYVERRPPIARWTD
jgi:hypothetical protein